MDPAEVVLGDVVVASQGDEIVVDGPLLTGAVEVDESLLTGESEGVHKSPGDEVKSGSAVLSGTGRYCAARVGADSYASQLTVRAREFQKRVTPIQREVDTVVRVLLLVTAFYVGLLALGSVLQHGSLLDFARATAVVFQIAPPGLFLVIVLAYALGAARIADQGVVVQQVESVESLCRVEVLCLDKTGTLTTNRFALAQVLPVAPGVTEDAARAALGHVRGVGHRAQQDERGHRRRRPGGARAPPRTRSPSPALASGARSRSRARTSSRARGCSARPEMLEPRLAPGAKWDPDGTAATWQREGMRVLLLARRGGATTLHAGDDTHRARRACSPTPSPRSPTSCAPTRPRRSPGSPRPASSSRSSAATTRTR